MMVLSAAETIRSAQLQPVWQVPLTMGEAEQAVCAAIDRDDWMRASALLGELASMPAWAAHVASVVKQSHSCWDSIGRAVLRRLDAWGALEDRYDALRIQLDTFKTREAKLPVLKEGGRLSSTGIFSNMRKNA
jgi:hypothetical protein